MKKIFSLLVIFTLLLGSLVACGPQEEPADTQASTSGDDKPEKLVIWEDKDKGVALEPALKSFEEKYGVKVEYKEVSMLDQQEKLRLDGPAGTGPDIILLPHDRIGPAVTEGIIAEVNYGDEVLNRFTESSIEAMKYEGKLYGLPKATETTVLIYNKALIDKAPETFDELYSFAEENTSGDNYGFLAKWDDFYFVFGMIKGYGGYVFGNEDGKPDPMDIGLNNSEAVKGLEYVKKWYEEGLFPNGILGENGGQTIDGLFTEGKVAVVHNGPWAFQGYRDAGIDFGVAPMPKLPNGENFQTFIGVKGWHVSSYSKHQEWAQKLIDHITNAENAKIRFEESGEIPPVKTLIADPVIADNEWAQAVAIQSQNGTPMPNIPEIAEVWEPMAQALQLTVTDQQEVKDAVDSAVNVIKQQIEAKHSNK